VGEKRPKACMLERMGVSPTCLSYAYSKAMYYWGSKMHSATVRHDDYGLALDDLR